MSIPKEPRQQMINIMYLVLTALLALNVSAEILKAFETIRKGINNSNSSVTNKITATMGAFAEKVKKEKRGDNFLAAAGKVREESAAFQAFIDSLDQELGNAIGIDTTTGALKNPGDQDVSSRLFAEGNLGNALEKRIVSTRQRFLSYLDAEDRKAVEANMALEVDSIPPGSDKKGWPMYTFYQMPAGGVRTLLAKYKSDAVASEATVVDLLFSKVSEKTILFDKFKAAVIPNSTRFITGETFEAQIYLAASSSMSRPTIVGGGRALPLDGDGVANYKTPVGGPGKYTFSGSITSKDSYGNQKSYPFTLDYEVMSPPDHAVIVSPDKMNVFYIGVDNPVTASITGMRPDGVSASMSGGTITKSGGASKYNVRVTSPGKASISLSGKKKDGSTYSGSADFRVKRIPDPIPEIGGKSGGAMGTGEFKAQGGIIASLKDFDFDAKFDVLGFEMTMAQKGQDLQTVQNAGPRFTGAAANLINQAKVGSIYYFDNITAKGPDGTTRKLVNIAFKIK